MSGWKGPSLDEIDDLRVREMVRRAQASAALARKEAEALQNRIAELTVMLAAEHEIAGAANHLLRRIVGSVADFPEHFAMRSTQSPAQQVEILEDEMRSSNSYTEDQYIFSGPEWVRSLYYTYLNIMKISSSDGGEDKINPEFKSAASKVVLEHLFETRLESLDEADCATEEMRKALRHLCSASGSGTWQLDTSSLDIVARLVACHFGSLDTYGRFSVFRVNDQGRAEALRLSSGL